MGQIANPRMADIAGALDYREQKIRADEERRKQIRSQQLAGEALSTGLREGSVLHRMASEAPDTYLLVAKATGIPANDGEQMQQYAQQLKYLSAMDPRQSFEQANQIVQKRQEMGLPPGPIAGYLESAMRDGPEVAYRALRAQAQAIGFDGEPAGVQEFEKMTQNLTPEEKEQARRVKLGLAPRAGISASERIAQDSELSGRVANLERETSFASTQGKEQAKEQFQVPVGYRRTEDGMVPIPGSPADQSVQEAIRERIEGMDITQRAARTVVDDTQRALDVLDKSGGWAAGAGSYLSVLPSTPARTLNKHIESIKGNIGIDSLLAIKRSGAGLGAIPQAQLEMLASLMGNLDAAQSPAELRYNLTRIEEIYSEIVEKSGGDPKEIPQEREARSRGRQADQELSLEDLLGRY